MKTFCIALASVLTVFAVAGCRHSANMSNPKVAIAVTELDASNTTKTITDGLTAADKVLDQIQAQEPDYYAKVRPLLTKIAKANDVASSAIVNAKNGGAADWRGAMSSLGQTVATSDLTTFGFKNSTSQKLVQDGFAVLISGLTLAAQFGGTK